MRIYKHLQLHCDQTAERINSVKRDFSQALNKHIILINS